MTAPEAKIMPVRVLDPNGETNLWVLAEAIRWAASPNNPNRADIINLSLGSNQRSNLLRNLVESCGGNGSIGEFPEVGNVVIVVAAGNGGKPSPSRRTGHRHHCARLPSRPCGVTTSVAMTAANSTR